MNYSGYQCGPYMAGRRKTGETTVLVKPCVVISCPSWKAFRALEKRICETEWVRIGSDTEYFKSDIYSTVQVYYGGARLATSSPAQINIPNLRDSEVTFEGYPHKLHVHIEVPRWTSNVRSVCGVVCCATITMDDAIVSQRISRVGGVLSMMFQDGHRELPLMTTGHGMLEDILWPQTEDGDDTSEDDHSDTPGDYASRDESDNESLGGFDPSTISAWIPVNPTKVISFVKSAVQQSFDETTGEGKDRSLLFSIPPSSSSNPYDMALLDIFKQEASTSPGNSFLDSDGNHHVLPSRSGSADTMLREVVLILARPGEKAIDAEVLPHKSSMFIRGQGFEAKELWLPGPFRMFIRSVAWASRLC